MCVPALRPHVQPFTLKGKVAKGDPGEQEEKGSLSEPTIRNANLMFFPGFRYAPPAHLHRNKLFLKAG